MTRSEARRRRAIEVLDEIADLLDEARLVERIDEPINQAARAFECPDGPGLSHRQFLDCAAEFIQYLYAKAFPGGRQLSRSEARDEAVALLETASGDAASSGYPVALFDATDPRGPGLPMVLLNLAELVKARHRNMYVNWVAATVIGSMDWQLKCDVTAVILERQGPYLPAYVQDRPAEQLAGYFLNLLAIELGSRHNPRSGSSAPADPFA